MTSTASEVRSLERTPHLPVGNGVRVIHRMYFGIGFGPSWRAHCERHGIVGEAMLISDVREIAVQHYDEDRAADMGRDDARGARPPLFCFEQGEDEAFWPVFGITTPATDGNAAERYALLWAYADAYDEQAGQMRSERGN